MRMGVNQTRHQHFTVAIKRFLPGIILFDLIIVAHCKDAITFYGNSSGEILGQILIHREDKGIGEEDVNWLCHWFSCDVWKGATYQDFRVEPFFLLANRSK